ncbi:MAG: hypothetical protein QW835_06360 [Candidatus Hadarchaeum sp.]|uniref:OmpL47-type beta-barrel domain-containing protein n=1 Tax=Candidatus Hadarchaeum sp. TaxID=2883567 RepID=UPI00317B5314
MKLAMFTVGLLVILIFLSTVPLVSAGSFTKYATTADGEGFASPVNAIGPPNEARSESWMGNEGYLWGGGFAAESGTIIKVVINVVYKVDKPAVDDITTLKYSLDGGASFGVAQLTWVPQDTYWTLKSLDITSDTSVNGGSWDWTDISNLRIYVQNTVKGEGDWPVDDTTVMVDAFYVEIITSETTSPTTPLTPLPQAFDFSMSASPETLTVQRSDSVSTTVSVKLVSGLPQAVLLSGLWVGTSPSGVTPFMGPLSGTPSFNSTLTFTADLSATTGTFTYQVKGISGNLARTVNVQITVAELKLPSAPLPLFPDDGAVLDTITPTFDWTDVVASTYTLEIATDNNFYHVVLTKTTVESIASLSQLEALTYGTKYYWRVRGTNSAGAGEWSLVRSFTAKVGAPKVTELLINWGANYVNSINVLLSISAINAVQMSFSTDGINWSSWEEFQPTKTFELPPPDGPKNVYVRVRDAAGDVGQSVLATVVMDSTPPTTRHFITGNLQGDVYQGSVVVTLVAEDQTSGVLETRYRVDNGLWNSGNTLVIIKEGEHRVEYYSTDRAGNIEATKFFDVIIATPSTIPPFILQYWWVMLSTAAAVVIAAVLVHRRLKITSRLKQIRREKAELPKLKRKAEIEYFKEGKISREAYDKLVEEYERRKVELEKEEKMLLAKLRKQKNTG